MTPNDDMEDVRRAYRDARDAGPDDGPPAALDDAIRAAARRAVHSRPQPAGQGWITRWRTPLSAAAVMVLAVSVVFVGMDERSDVAPASLQQAKQDLRQSIPAAPPVAGADTGIAALQDEAPAAAKKDAGPGAVAVQERAPLETRIVPADVLRPVPAPEVRIESPAILREKKMAQAGSGAVADNNVARQAEDAARNRAAVVAKEKAIADLSAGRRDVAAPPPPAQTAAVGAVAAVTPVIVPAPAAPAVTSAPVIAFAPTPPAAVAGAPAPSRAMASAPASVSASAPASVAAPIASSASPVTVIDGAKLSEALARQSRQEPANPAKPAESAEARYTAAASQTAKAEVAGGALPPPVAPQAMAAAKDRLEKITVTGSLVAPPVYAPPAPPVKSLVEQKETAEAWIKRMEQLVKDNKLKEAREELARFRKAYPNATLPPALAKLPAE